MQANDSSMAGQQPPVELVSRGDSEDVSGEFVVLDGERFYCIHNIDRMQTFFISLISSGNHWLFAASNGGLTAGRVSPDTALFPYITVDRIYESTSHTGCVSLLRVQRSGQQHLWEPFKVEHEGRYRIRRNLYRNTASNVLLFEEINEDLQLAYRYRWSTSHEYGFVRDVELQNFGDGDCDVHLLDGLRNLLPAGTPRGTQALQSYLLDAYKWSELDPETGLGLFTLYSAVSDRAEPAESLRASTVFQLGLDDPTILLSTEQLEQFRLGGEVTTEDHCRGLRGAYLACASFALSPRSSRKWQIIADVEQSQADCIRLQQQLRKPAALRKAIADSIERGTRELLQLMAGADCNQLTASEPVDLHHYSNVLFNVLRGGIFDDNYRIGAARLSAHMKTFNRPVFARHRGLLEGLPDVIDVQTLLQIARDTQDADFERLVYEYLPITFGRRHGDPSRPWNEFAIVLQDEHGERLLRYQGNWRDIFQNWEALLLSYPQFTEHVIAKFVNASTVDGYNPYRITSEGIDWEVEDPEDPWSYIGYWGDHQIIYLQKLLELSSHFHPGRLEDLLHRKMFCYANVPYRIRPFEDLMRDPKNTVLFDEDLARLIDERVERIGADGRLLLDDSDNVVLVNLTEKLLVTLLAKLGNLVPEGGIWLNTQRPEWNDANNALVGAGLSMVTLYYMRRYLLFLQNLLSQGEGNIELSKEVAQWLGETASLLQQNAGVSDFDDHSRGELTTRLGRASSDYRQALYSQRGFSGSSEVSWRDIGGLIDNALQITDRSIAHNRRADGLYHAYNLMHHSGDRVSVENLYLMLEGQVAALSSGAVTPEGAVQMLTALFDSDLYREDQKTFLLYPDRQPVSFLQRNRIPANRAAGIELVSRMLERGDMRLVVQDPEGGYRFHHSLQNAGVLAQRLRDIEPDYPDLVPRDTDPLLELYEHVFQHRQFTGRSGGMFAFEGLGSIYWHMVGKLLLAVQEAFFSARDQGADAAVVQQLGQHYYRVRAGLGFNKTPQEYGAFPSDPYSHTPRQRGAQQPGMTGQVKEEVLSRFGELGVRVAHGALRFDPALLQREEFRDEDDTFRYYDVSGQWQELPLAAPSLAFTVCQVPVRYQLTGETQATTTVHRADGSSESFAGAGLNEAVSAEIFSRSGSVSSVELMLPEGELADYSGA